MNEITKIVFEELDQFHWKEIESYLDHESTHPSDVADLLETIVADEAIVPLGQVPEVDYGHLALLFLGEE